MNDLEQKENSLTKVINETGVELDTADLIQKNFSEFYEQVSQWKSKSNIIVSDASQKREMKLAKETRLIIKQIRNDAEKTRKRLKEDSNRYGKAVQAAYNLIESECKPLEDYLELQEKFVEIQEEKRIADLKAKREIEINPYVEFIPIGLNLGTMQDCDYDKLINGAKLQLAAKQEAEAKAEKERLEKLEAERIENERIRIENEKLRLEAIEKQKELDEQKRLAKIESDRLAEIAKNERLEKEKLEQAEKERKEKEQLELKAKQEAENKKLQASDKEKLLALSDALSLIEFPKVESDKANSILSQAIERVQKTIKTIQDEANKL